METYQTEYLKKPATEERNRYPVELPALISHSDFCTSTNSSIPVILIMDDENEDECNNGYYVVPVSSNVSWSEIEETALTLGLHIFGKNFALVKKFMCSKTVPDILHFYYTKFQLSNNYRRWDEYMKIGIEECNAHRKYKMSRTCNNCRKARFRRPWKRELLSRLQLDVPEESQSKFMEVSKTFLNRIRHLEGSFLALKDLLGLQSLIKAFGFGNENDPTLFSKDYMKPTRATQKDSSSAESLVTSETMTGKKRSRVQSVKEEFGRPEKMMKSSTPRAASVRATIGASRDYSELTPAETIRLLKGDSRRSKTQSSDLFWEAVWPRLLARGWRSEQQYFTRSSYYALSNNGPLLFIYPGVEKASRKLVKGTHFFDSISDVMSHVASKPHLIEPKTVVENGITSKEGNEGTKGPNLSLQYSSPDHQSHYHDLQIQTVDANAVVMMFKVLDTSMRDEKLANRRSLPTRVVKYSASESRSLLAVSKEVVVPDHAYSSAAKDEPPRLKTKLDLNLPYVPDVEATDELDKADQRQLTDARIELDDRRVVPVPAALDMEISRRRTRPTIKLLEDLASEFAMTKHKRKGLSYLQAKLQL